MRISLRTQITAALVLFGLVPASIVAWFAYQTQDDFKDKQKLIVRQAAEAMSQRIGVLARVRTRRSTGEDPGRRQVDRRREERRSKNIITDVVSQFNLDDLGQAATAQVFIVDPDNKLILERTETGNLRPRTAILPIFHHKYEEAAKDARKNDIDNMEIAGVPSDSSFLNWSSSNPGRGRRLRPDPVGRRA